jgi:hypothetical protein
MQTLQVALSKSQYERLRDEAEKRNIVANDLVLEIIEAFLASEDVGNRYARLARKQATWHDRRGAREARLVREQAADYTVRTDRSLDARLADLRLDLIYHSESLEGSPLTRAQVEDAIEEQSTR